VVEASDALAPATGSSCIRRCAVARGDGVERRPWPASGGLGGAIVWRSGGPAKRVMAWQPPARHRNLRALHRTTHRPQRASEHACAISDDRCRSEKRKSELATATATRDSQETRWSRLTMHDSILIDIPVTDVTGVSVMQVRSADSAEIGHLAWLWARRLARNACAAAAAGADPPSAPSRAFASGCRPHSRTSALPARSASPSASASSRVRSCISFSCRARHAARASPRR
jgi:hypothetical protein